MAFTRDLKSLIVDDFRAEHAVAILAKHDDPSRWEEQARIIEESGQALTVFIDDEPAMCVGIIDIWEGLGEVWIVVSDAIQSRPVSVARGMRELLDGYFEQGGYRRIQSNVRADWDTARLFAEFVGMKEEGMMPSFGPEGADYVRYAKVI